MKDNGIIEVTNETLDAALEMIMEGATVEEASEYLESKNEIYNYSYSIKSFFETWDYSDGRKNVKEYTGKTYITKVVKTPTPVFIKQECKVMDNHDLDTFYFSTEKEAWESRNNSFSRRDAESFEIEATGWRAI